MKKYTTLDFCEHVLKQTDKPMRYHDIYDVGRETEFYAKWNPQGKTPWDTIAAQLYVDVRDNESSRFFIVSKKPTLFFLKERKDNLPSLNIIIRNAERDEEKTTTKLKFKERDLHPLLTYYAYSNLKFNKGKAIITKTILHEKSKKKGYNEWSHPDMVGFYFPTDEWDEKIIEFNKATGHNPITLYSFELKISISKSNYREYFFQTVSNSSWSNEGYLITTEIIDDEDLLVELERLSQSFGIGIIILHINDINRSEVLFPAKRKENLDWGMMNKLAEQNPDFLNFIDDVKKDYDIKRISKDRYDKFDKNIEDYIEDSLLSK